MGQADMAVEMLKKAKAGAPDLLEPYLHLSLAYVRMGRMAEAEATMAEARMRFPGQASTLVKLMADMKAQMAEGPPSLPGDPHASVPAPGSSAAPLASAPSSTGAPGARAPAPVAASGTGVAGTLELDASLQASPLQAATVFITLRAAGVTSGPPVAVKRLPGGSFPLAFSIGAADSMMGQELPERVRIEARADADGDPLTRPASDPVGRADDVRLGTSNLRLVLKR
jgi:cytochrome c-type biogenesis protein CcmH